MPKRTDLETILIIGSGPIVIGQACEFDYSGTQACRVLRAEGYRVVLGELEPGDDHDRPRVRRRHLRRTARPRHPHPHHRTRAARRAAPHARRADRAQPRHRARRRRGARAVRRRAHRRQRRGDPHRGEPPRVQGGDGGDRPRGATLGLRVHARGRDGDRRAGGLPAHRAAVVHPGRRGYGHGVERRRDAPRRRARPRDQPGVGDPGGAVGRGLEGVRARGDARPRRQRRRRVLDRELRRHGRAHRRLDHRRARADAHRRRVPAHA